MHGSFGESLKEAEGISSRDEARKVRHDDELKKRSWRMKKSLYNKRAQLDESSELFNKMIKIICVGTCVEQYNCTKKSTQEQHVNSSKKRLIRVEPRLASRLW